MVEISISEAGRRFGVDWIFKDLNYTFNSTEPTVVVGHNGSGKSTLLKILSGALSLSRGSIKYQIDGNTVNVDDVYKSLSICAPYLSLPEEFKLSELLNFHQSISPLNRSYNAEEFSDLIGLSYHPEKIIHLYSSGMKQRVKLALALLSTSRIVLLDEPLSNLDESGKNWYRKMIEDNSADKLFVVCSNNIEDEHFFCTKRLQISDYKPGT